MSFTALPALSATLPPLLAALPTCTCIHVATDLLYTADRSWGCQLSLTLLLESTAESPQQQAAYMSVLPPMVQLQPRSILATDKTKPYLLGNLAAGRAAWQVLECLAWLGAVGEVAPRHVAARQSTREVTCKQRCAHWAEPVLMSCRPDLLQRQG